MQRLGTKLKVPNRVSKILYSALADLDMNFVFEGRMWFLWVSRLLLPDSYGKSGSIFESTFIAVFGYQSVHAQRLKRISRPAVVKHHPK